MKIYERPVKLLMRDAVNDLGLEKGHIVATNQILDWFGNHYPLIKKGTITAHLIRLSTNAPSRIHYNAKPEDDLFFKVGGSRFRLFDSASDPPPIYSGKDSTMLLASPEAPASEFAYESDLRDFLAKNLNHLEPGLKLYRHEDVNGIEFPAGGRFIDILALDGLNNFVVIELKVSKGYDRTIGQLLRYIGWIEQNLAEAGQKVRGIIVGREISEDLTLACSRVSGVDLYEYNLSVVLRKVEGVGAISAQE